MATILPPEPSASGQKMLLSGPDNSIFWPLGEGVGGVRARWECLAALPIPDAWHPQALVPEDRPGN
jgi:hypothetical protein